MLPAEIGEGTRRPPVEQRVLHLGGDDIDAGSQKLGQMLGIEVGDTNVANLAFMPQRVEATERILGTGQRIVPPVELHQIEAIDAEPGERAVDDGVDVSGTQGGQGALVGDELGVHLHLPGGLDPAPIAKIRQERPDHRLDARCKCRHSRRW